MIEQDKKYIEKEFEALAKILADFQNRIEVLEGAKRFDTQQQGQVEPVVKVQIADVEEKYNELIMAVARKHPNETRHETALRYIKEAEIYKESNACNNPSSNLSA